MVGSAEQHASFDAAVVQRSVQSPIRTRNVYVAGAFVCAENVREACGARCVLQIFFKNFFVRSRHARDGASAHHAQPIARGMTHLVRRVARTLVLSSRLVWSLRRGKAMGVRGLNTGWCHRLTPEAMMRGVRLKRAAIGVEPLCFSCSTRHDMSPASNRTGSLPDVYAR